MIKEDIRSGLGPGRLYNPRILIKALIYRKHRRIEFSFKRHVRTSLLKNAIRQYFRQLSLPIPRSELVTRPLSPKGGWLSYFSSIHDHYDHHGHVPFPPFPPPRLLSELLFFQFSFLLELSPSSSSSRFIHTHIYIFPPPSLSLSFHRCDGKKI